MTEDGRTEVKSGTATFYLLTTRLNGWATRLCISQGLPVKINKSTRFPTVKINYTAVSSDGHDNVSTG